MLGFKFVENYYDINHFEVVETSTFTPTQDAYIFIQLVHVNGLRYIPATGATVEVTFENIDTSHNVTRLAVGVNPEDRSLWKVSILSTDKIANGSMVVKLTESPSIKTLNAFSDLLIKPIGDGRFFA